MAAISAAPLRSRSGIWPTSGAAGPSSKRCCGARRAAASRRCGSCGPTGEEQRLLAAQRFVAALAAERPLREGLGQQAVIDITWTLTSPEHYQALVAERGWSRARYEHWLD